MCFLLQKEAAIGLKMFLMFIFGDQQLLLNFRRLGLFVKRCGPLFTVHSDPVC